MENRFIYITERHAHRVFIPSVYHCYNKLSNLVYSSKTNLFYKLINSKNNYTQYTSNISLLHDVMFEFKDMNHLVRLDNSFIRTKSEILYQMFMIAYMLYREGISIVNDRPIIFDIYEYNVPIYMDIVFDYGYSIPLKTRYQVKLSTLNELTFGVPKAEIYYVFLLKEQLGIEWSMRLSNMSSLCKELNFIILLLFQLDIVCNSNKQALSSHNGMISTKDVNRNHYYRIGTVFEYRMSPIKVNRCISIENVNKYNDTVKVYDFDLNKVIEKDLDIIKLLEGINLGSNCTQIIQLL